MKRFFNTYKSDVPVYEANKQVTPVDRFINATKDVTEKDIAMMRYRQLQSEAAARMLLKQRLTY